MFDSYYKSTYRKSETGAYVIPISLHSYDDIFDDWDASPFKKRDVEDQFLEFLWDSSLDIPLREAIRVEFSVPSALRSDKKEKQMVEAIQLHFNYMLNKNKRAYRVERAESLKYFLLGIIFFLLAYLPVFKGKEIFSQIISEGLIVGTWVFMWEGFSNLFIESRSLRHDQQVIQRFLKSEFIFLDKE